MTSPSNKVSNFELAVLVLRYLETTGCTKAATAFKREAKQIFANQSPDSLTGIKPLSDVVDEYLTLESQQRQRNHLAQTNLLAQSIYATLDQHAGIQSTNQPLQPLQPQPQTNTFITYTTQPPSTTQQHYLIGTTTAPTTTTTTLVPISTTVDNNNQQITPGRHVQRKRALPRKKRKIDLDNTTSPLDALPSFFSSPPNSQDADRTFDLLAQSSLDFTGSLPGSQDLLNKTMTQDQIALLLTDLPLQSKFAEGLAHQINQADPNSLFDMLLTDPEITAVLQTLVATEEGQLIDTTTTGNNNGGGGGDDNNNNRQEQQQEGGKNDGEKRKDTTIEDGLDKRKESENAKENECGKKETHDTAVEEAGNVDDVIARFMSNPEQFEDLIDECVG